jgi:anti-sigma factor RsiW
MTAMTACADRIAALDALFAGDLAEKEADALRSHLQGCDGCRAYHDRLWTVEAALERRAMPSRAVDELEQRLLARAKSQAQAERPEPWWKRPWVLFGAPLAAVTAMAVVVLVAIPRRGPDEFQPRGGESAPAFGVRAFCIGPGAAVTGEARPGESLTCPEGSAIQLSVTAAQAGRVTAVARAPSGEPQELAKGVTIAAGADAPLPFSTPSAKSWLSGPTRLTVQFESDDGKVRLERELTLLP